MPTKNYRYRAYLTGEQRIMMTKTFGCVRKNYGSYLDRDYKAALNVLLAAGLAESLNACGGDIRLRLSQKLIHATPEKLSNGKEAGTHRTTLNRKV